MKCESLKQLTSKNQDTKVANMESSAHSDAMEQGVSISMAHIQELIDTNKALRESVISIAAALKEQSLSNSYRRKRGRSHDSGISFASPSPSAQGYGPSVFGKEMEIASVRSLAIRQYEENWIEVRPLAPEVIAEEMDRRRREYKGNIDVAKTTWRLVIPWDPS